MPGTPSTSPRFGAPRFANADQVDFAGQVNGVTDAFDATAARFSTGTIAARPVAGSVPDRTFYRATDRVGQTDELSVAVGAAWKNVLMDGGTVGPDQLSPAMTAQLGISSGGIVRRAISAIDTAEANTTSAAYTAAPTPDRVSGLVVPANAILWLAFKASVVATIGFGWGLWVDGTQVGGIGGLGSTAGVTYQLGTYATPNSLASSFGPEPAGTVPRLAFANAVAVQVDPAGTHSAEIRYKLDSAGSVTTSKRRLWAWVQGA